MDDRVTVQCSPDSAASSGCTFERGSMNLSASCSKSFDEQQRGHDYLAAGAERECQLEQQPNHLTTSTISFNFDHSDHTTFGEGSDEETEASDYGAFGRDCAADYRATNPEITFSAVLGEPAKILSPNADEEEATPTDDGGYWAQIPIPSSTNGLATFAYQQALGNRIRNHKLASGAQYDIRAYTPTFVHDCFMLPGTLAHLLGKHSVPSYIEKMTPALLPGFRAYVRAETLEPCILQSQNSRDSVQGMLVFGLGRSSRNLIAEHYSASGQRVKVDVHVDIVEEIPMAQRVHPEAKWCLARRSIAAHVWLWSNAAGDEVCPGSAWTLEDYIEGNLGGRQETMSVHPTGKGEDEDDIGEGYEMRMDGRQIVYGGAGELDYKRDDEVAFSGW